MAKGNLSISGDILDVEIVKITAKKAKEILNNGISEYDLDDLMGDSETESGIQSGTVYVGETGVLNFHTDNLPEGSVFQMLGPQDKAKWILVKEEFQRGTHRIIPVKDDFDSRLLHYSKFSHSIRGKIFSFVSFSYDGEEGEFDEAFTRSRDYYLIDPKGETHQFDISEEDDDEDEDADD